MNNKYSKYVKTEALRMERLKNKFSYMEMAQMLGFKTATSYYNIEVGKTMPTLKIINAISDIFKKPAEKFFIIKVQQR